MQVIGGLAKFLFSPLLQLTGVLGHKKPPPPPLALPLLSATRDDARAQVGVTDELRRRQGAAADILTGTRGAEAAGSTGKLVLSN